MRNNEPFSNKCLKFDQKPEPDVKIRTFIRKIVMDWVRLIKWFWSKLGREKKPLLSSMVVFNWNRESVPVFLCSSGQKGNSDFRQNQRSFSKSFDCLNYCLPPKYAGVASWTNACLTINWISVLRCAKHFEPNEAASI